MVEEVRRGGKECCSVFARRGRHGGLWRGISKGEGRK